MDSPDVSGMSHDDLHAEIRRLRRELSGREAAEAARRLVTARLKAERDAFRSAFDNSPVIQIWCDPQGRALRVNKAAQEAMRGGELPPDFTVLNDPQLILLGVPEY